MGTATLSVQLQHGHIFVWNDSNNLDDSLKCSFIVVYSPSPVEAGHSI